MTKGKGYLLPSGDASEDELECCMVFYPARDEYRRALMGSLDYLATWIAWERDSAKRGQDAAASWKLANIQTWECCSMGYCDDLLTTVEEMLVAIKAIPSCCGDQDITDGRQYTDEVVDGVGDVPQNIIDAGYADDAADWDGFDDYKCMISHLSVDHVESFFREISPHISDTGIVIGGIGVIGALVGGILTVAGLPISAGIIIALGAAAAIWSWITSEGRQAVDDLADEIATNHDALVCAIYLGDGVTDGIDEFNAEVDSLFSTLNAIAIKAINLEPQLRAMYAGRYDQEDIAEKMDELGYELVNYDCSGCVYVFDIDIDEDFQTDPPADDLFQGGIRRTDPNDLPNWVQAGDAGITINTLKAYTGGFTFGPGDKLEFHRVKFDGMRRGTAGTRYIIRHDGGTEVLVLNDAWTIGVWQVDLEFNFNPPLVYTYPGGSQIENFEQDVVSGHPDPFLDNLEMDIDIELV